MLKLKDIKTILFLFCLTCSLISYAGSLEIVFPKENYTTINPLINIKWNKITSISTYQIQISDDILFTSTLVDAHIGSNNYSYTFPQSNKMYYIRVKAPFTSWSDVRSIKIANIGVASNKLWLDGVNSTVSGGLVTSWTDVVHANAATQGSTASQPQRSLVPLLNNLPAIIFNGNSSGPAYLTLANTINATDYDLFVVRSYVNNSNFVQYFLGGGGNGFFSEADYAGCGFGAYNSSMLATVAANLKTNYSIYETQPNKNYTNGVIETYCSGDNVRGISVNTIGTRPDVLPLAYQGGIAEMIAFDTILNDDFKTDVGNYLHDKYAPPVNLGTDTVVGNSFCDSIVLDAGNRFVTYNWSNGSTSRFAKVLTNNKYTVTVKDVFGKVSTDDIVVCPYVRLNNANIYICSGDTFKLDLKTPAGFTALWNHGPNTTKINITQTGRYIVTITDPNSCSVKDTINVTVDNPKLSIAPVSNNINACFGEKLFIQTETSFDSIRWSTGSTNNFIQLSDSGIYSINAVTSIGCIFNKSFHVNVVGRAPTANFGLSAPCDSTLVNFHDSTSVPNGNSIASWKWTFSNNTTSGIQNPNVGFPLGVASAALKVTTNVGCTDSIYKSFVINKRPVASFDNRLSCEGNPTTFIDQTVPNSAATVDWSWYFNGLGIINGVQNPSFRFPTAGSYNIKLVATNSNGCKDSITRSIDVNSSPHANFSNDQVCGRTPVTLKFLATVDTPSVIPSVNWGKWDFGDGSIETAIKNPQHIYATPGTYDVSLIVYSSNQCVDTIVKQVKVFDFPVVDFDVSETQCTGKAIQFTDLTSTPDGTPITKWNWFFSGQATDTIQNPRYTFNTAGNYTIQLTAKNEVGCSGTKLRSIAVTAPPTPRFTFSPQNGLPPLNVNYINQSPVSGNYTWSYGDGSPLVNTYNPPQHVYTAIGSYPIKLIATDFRGCTDTLTKYILVDKAYLDGVMASISIIPDGDFYKIQATIINNSNIEITALGLSLQLGGGAIIRENWAGSLLPGQTTVYLFTGEIKLSDNSQIPVVCASIDNVNNNSFEDRTDNNSTCKEVKVGSFDVFNVYPNPATEGINFGVMLPKDGKVNIRFIDALGQLMYNKDFDGVRGYNSLAMPTSMLNAAVYVAEVSFDGEVVRKKFMRKDKK